METQGRINLFTLGVDKNDAIVETSGRSGFSLDEYGRLKYCDNEAARVYGKMLADALTERCGNMLDAGYYVAASGIKYVPSAAHSLLSPLVAALTLNGVPPMGMFRIDRGIVKAVDYSLLSYEERAQSNSGRRVTIPDVSRQEIKNRHVIVVDDIRVSGQTEEETRNCLGTAEPASVLYAYVAVLDERVGTANSAIEHRLTHATVRQLSDLVPIVNSGSFVLNARTCKFILRANPEEIRIFVASVPQLAMERILASMVADGYHIMPEHANSFAALVNAMRLPLLVN